MRDAFVFILIIPRELVKLDLFRLLFCLVFTKDQPDNVLKFGVDSTYLLCEGKMY